MKKQYITPAAVIVEIQNCSIICKSPDYPVRNNNNANLYEDISSDEGYDDVIR